MKRHSGVHCPAHPPTSQGRSTRPHQGGAISGGTSNKPGPKSGHEDHHQDHQASP